MRASVLMLPRLSGQEAIRSSNVIAVGTGSMEEQERGRVVSTWNRQAHPQPQRKAATPRQMQAIGIGVRQVQKRS